MNTDWDGKGLPPVGAKLEAKNHRHGRTDKKWCVCEVLFSSKYYVILKSDEFIGQDEAVCLPSDLEFRPLKTKEQRDAEKRLHEIRNACTAINSKVADYNANLDCSAAMRATIEAMIDAGYRKFEIVEEDV